MLGHLLKGRKTPIKAAEQKALLGRIECDSPKALVEYIMTLFNQVTSDEPVNFIILNGDLIGHGIA